MSRASSLLQHDLRSYSHKIALSNSNINEDNLFNFLTENYSKKRLEIDYDFANSKIRQIKNLRITGPDFKLSTSVKQKPQSTITRQQPSSEADIIMKILCC